MTGKCRAALLSVVSGLLLATTSFALDVSMEVSRKEVTVGEQFTLAVEVSSSGVGRVPAPELPEVSGVRQISSVSSQNFSYVNGKATSSLVLQYVMIADNEGTYTLGPATAGSGADAARSEPVTIVVKPAGSATTAPRFGAAAEEATSGGNDLVVLGQVDDDLRSKPPLGRPSPDIRHRGGGHQRNRHAAARWMWLRLFQRRVRLAQGSQYTPPSTTGFWTEQLDTTDPREVTLDGRRYVAERVRIALFPTGPGEHTIGEAYLRTTVPDARRSSRRDPFDFFGGNDPFGVFGGGREVLLKTDAVTVKVRALPEEGKPKDFCGAVGQFTLTAKVDKTAAKAGEAITLTVRLAGTGNVKVVAPPDLSEMDGFKVYDSKSNESSRAVDGRIQGEKVWEFVVVPTAGGEVSIPSVHLSVFDPGAGKYVSLATDAIPLDVEATPMDEALARGGDASLAKERVRLRERDIRYVKPAAGHLTRGGTGPWRDPVFLFAHALPILAFAGSVFARRQRDRLRSDRRYARRRGAAKAAGKRLDAARAALGDASLEPVFAATSAALRGYVADRFHLAAANLDEGAVRTGLSDLGVGDESTAAFFDMLAACDGARFSPLGSDAAAAGELVERARHWVGEAERR